MKNKLLALSIFICFVFKTNAQETSTWSRVLKDKVIQKSKNTERISFPKNFVLMEVNLNEIRNNIKNAPNRINASKKAIISLPNVDGKIEKFQIFEASNFDKKLQTQFPEIRSYVGKGIDDPKAVLRMSLDPNGIQAMIFRSDKRNEFIEPYSADGKVYAVFNSERTKGKLPFTCSTEDQNVSKSILMHAKNQNTNKSNSGELLYFRLAMSCNGEYTQYHGGTVAGALAAINATMTRVNGVFEKDFGIHMNLIANTTSVIYTNPNTDPYSPNLNQWNAQLQSTLTSVIGEANYDVGHMFGASGGGGNAGCIGCVCVDGQKGSGITSPADGIPQGDNFDIDYVAHELGHQFGANHTFSMNNEGSGVNMEVGSGSTIMGYAGITAQDVQPHSDDYFHYASIFQVESNMEGKTCPTRVTMTNSAPVADAALNYTIPKSTPFILTGFATDVNGDPLTYCWEQIDNASGTQTGASSAASATKATGPNWRSYNPTSSPSRYFPPLSRVIANQSTTQGADITVEALSSVARTLNFALTVRDNAGLEGQTDTDAMVVTVNGTAGPFTVSAPNTAVTWQAGTNQNVTWNVAGTTANGVNSAYVDIYLSVDGGYTYPYLLASKVPNDGSETITVPNATGNQNRVMVKGWNHIFYDISNTNFTISAPASTFSVAFNGVAGEQNKEACQGSTVNFTIPYQVLGGFSGTTSFSVSGQPVGSTVTFTPSTITTSGNVTMSISNTAGSLVQLYAMTVTATSGATSKTVPFYLNLVNGNFGTQILTSPINMAVGQSTSTVLTWPANVAATSYDVQVASDIAFTNIVSSGTVITNSYTASGLLEATDYYWRVKPKNDGCEGVYSSSFTFKTGASNCTYSFSNNNALNVPDGPSANTYGTEVTKTILVPGTVTGNINSLTVDLSFNHTYVDDLQVWITHPDGTPVYLWNHNCEDEFSSVTLTYADGNASIPTGNSCTLGVHNNGTFAPNTPLSVLAGKPAAGIWVLHARDYWNGDTGTINNWSLNLCIADAALSNEVFELEGVTIYPNPNNGNFVLGLVAASDKVSVEVYDTRGRLMFNKSIQGNGLINETINLDYAQSGIYFVNIQDGFKKVIKKIIVE